MHRFTFILRSVSDTECLTFTLQEKDEGIGSSSVGGSSSHSSTLSLTPLSSIAESPAALSVNADETPAPPRYATPSSVTFFVTFASVFFDRAIIRSEPISQSVKARDVLIN